jgi:LPXTG-motif cell wall-anchored protein
MLHRRGPRPAAASALVALVAAASVCLVPGVAAADDDRPGFQLPFPCGETWRLDSWGHAPALDMVREPDQEGTEGSRLVAPAGGTVVESFRHDNAGEVVQIDHGGGWFTTYLHLDSRAVGVGDEVQQGDDIGRVGRTGPTANDHPHLHFELAVDEDGDGSASWGFSGSERVRPWFDGVEYGQEDGRTWRDVESANCGEPAPATTTTTAPPETTTTTVAPPTTLPPTTAAVVPAASPTTTVEPAVVAPATTMIEPEETGSGGMLPRTGASGTTVAVVVGSVLLAVGGVLVAARRRATR